MLFLLKIVSDPTTVSDYVSKTNFPFYLLRGSIRECQFHLLNRLIIAIPSLHDPDEPNLLRSREINLDPFTYGIADEIPLEGSGGCHGDAVHCTVASVQAFQRGRAGCTGVDVGDVGVACVR